MSDQRSMQKDNWKTLARRALIGALALDLFFGIGFVITQHLPITPPTKPLIFLFNLNLEGNPPTWWQGTQLLLTGLCFLLLSAWFFQSQERVAPLRRLFMVCGLGFVYLSADEIGQIHEYLSRLLQSWHALNLLETYTLAALGKKVHRFHGGGLWILVFGVIGLVLLWKLWPQLKLAWKLWRREILLFASGFAVLVLAATVIETLGCFIPKEMVSFKIFEVGVEETLEAIGSSIVFFSAVSVLAKAASGILPGSVERPAEQTNVVELGEPTRPAEAAGE
jgi:hypothetical protein